MKNEKIEQAISKHLESKVLVLMSYPPEYIEDVKTDMACAFRKGAEWMAGQFQQEQPEVDLEKEFAHEYAIYHLPNFIIASIVDGTELIDFIYKTAHHFYELGLNARKEE